MSRIAVSSKRRVAGRYPRRRHLCTQHFNPVNAARTAMRWLSFHRTTSDDAHGEIEEAFTGDRCPPDHRRAAVVRGRCAAAATTDCVFSCGAAVVAATCVEKILRPTGRSRHAGKAGPCQVKESYPAHCSIDTHGLQPFEENKACLQRAQGKKSSRETKPARLASAFEASFIWY